MFGGKNKAVTFSYDDGVTQDIRLMEIFAKYGLKGTFNLNSELFGKGGPIVRGGKTANHIRVKKEDVRHVYDGFEIAVHTLTHPSLPPLSDREIVRQVEQDRINLSEVAGYEVVGMAYPSGGGVFYDERTAGLIRESTGVKYARITESSFSFDLQEDLYLFCPTAYHRRDRDRLFALAEEFIALQPDSPKLFYIWGHSYEFDLDGDWDWFESFCRLIGGHDDIFYGTNKEVLL